jgi:hypothetical protein
VTVLNKPNAGYRRFGFGINPMKSFNTGLFKPHIVGKRLITIGFRDSRVKGSSDFA